MTTNRKERRGRLIRIGILGHPVDRRIVVTPAGPETGTTTYPPQPPRYVWISAPRAHQVRVACGRLGNVLIAACVLLVPTLVLLGGRLPPIYPALSALSWIFTATGVIQVLVAAIVLFRARRYVPGEHLDLQGARTTRAGIGTAWACTFFTTAFACLGLSLGLSKATYGPDDQVVHNSAATWALLLLLAMPTVLTGVAFHAARRLFRPPSDQRR